jgi:predicted phage terminase large subunit-like protein
VGLSVFQELQGLTDAEIDAMDPATQLRLAQIVKTNLLLESPAAFATGLSHELWQPYPHLEFTSNAIVDMVEHDDTDLLVIDQPVRHGKTELCSRWTPAWYLARHPDRRVLLASYEADFAATHGRRVREILLEHGDRFGVAIDATSRAAARWEVEGTQGGMNTAGAGGPITGKGGHLLILDDPIKNIEEAQSQVMRDHLWEWWQNVWLTRREPGVKFLLIMSRWHEDDLVGRLLKAVTGMRIKRLRMPAIAEGDDLLGRRPGDALCPLRFDEEALDRIRVDVGPNAWASLYQQRPTLAGGGMFRRDRFQTWSVAKETEDTKLYRLGETVVDDAAVWRFATMDPAFIRSRRSDYTAIAVWGVAPTAPNALMLLDVRRQRITHAGHAELIKEVWDRWAPAWVGIEKQMATLSLFDEVQRKGVVVRWLKPDKNKIARAETAVALVDAGRVFLPANAVWLGEFLDEVVSFPVAAHDDQVDVLAYAAAELAKRTVHPRVVRHEPQTHADKAWAQLEKRAKRKHMHPVLGRFN